MGSIPVSVLSAGYLLASQLELPSFLFCHCMGLETCFTNGVINYFFFVKAGFCEKQRRGVYRTLSLSNIYDGAFLK